MSTNEELSPEWAAVLEKINRKIIQVRSMRQETRALIGTARDTREELADAREADRVEAVHDRRRPRSCDRRRRS